MKWIRMKKALLVTIGCLIYPAIIVTNVYGQDSPPRYRLNIYEENDVFATGSGSDIHYTQGLRLEFLWQAKAKPKLFHVPGYNATDHLFTSGIVLAQNLYTPKNITDELVSPNDRPYAAWLYLGLKYQVVSKFLDWQDTYELDFGVVGPPAFGDQIQSGWHEIIGADNPTWVGQLSFAPAVMLSYNRKWLLDAPVAVWYSNEGSFRAYIIPQFGVNLGNVFTDLGIGSTFLIGMNTPRNFDAAQSNPSIMPDEQEGGFRFYLSLRATSRVVVYNHFLDRKFGDDFKVDRHLIVADFVFGVHVDFWRFTIAHLQIFRSPEIKTETNFHHFGAFQVTIKF